MVAGTPWYMVPEKLFGNEIDASSDLFAVGVVLYECLTGSALSGYLSFALYRGYANGAVTGAFCQLAQPNTTFDFDHDQHITAVANVVYTFGKGCINTTGTYGTGLTNSYSPDATAPYTTGSVANGTYQPGSTLYCTGLLCFNSVFKVPPSFIEQFAVGYTMLFGQTHVRPEFFLDNA